MAVLPATSIAPNASGGNARHLLRASVVVNHDNGSARVDLDGDLCAASTSLVTDLRARLAAQGVHTVRVGLSELRLCTSHGAAELETWRADLADRGGALILEDPRPVVDKVLGILGIPLVASPGRSTERVRGRS
jgi:anti-anti-sigma regulatory factor